MVMMLPMAMMMYDADDAAGDDVWYCMMHDDEYVR